MALLLKGFSDETVDTGEVEIGYSVGPDNGPTLLLAHGVTSRRDSFLSVLDVLTAKYRVVTMDQRGHGYSGHPGEYGREDHARDINFILENVCDAPTILWGHSMGGANSVGVAINPPSQLKALVLEDAAVFPRVRPPSASNSPTMSMFQISLDLIDADATVEEAAARFREAYPNWPDYIYGWKAESILQMDADILRNVIGGTSSFSPGDPAETLARIKCPVLLMQADPTAGGILADDFLAEVVPDSDDWTVVKIEGAGHNIHREHSELLLSVVLPWLETQSGA
jgi:pimeloyl-ACP methyl ester carboxylesterase